MTHNWETTVGALYVAAQQREDESEAKRIEEALDAGPRIVDLNEQYSTLPFALHYAAKGWPTFPLSPNSKMPVKDTNGLLDATTNTETLSTFWPYAYSNIGLATGHYFDVIDVDGTEGMATIVEGLKHNPAMPELIAIALTPRGIHLYVPATGRRNSARIMAGVDYRGAGGYVVAPPSRLTGVPIDRANYKYEDCYRWLMIPKEA